MKNVGKWLWQWGDMSPFRERCCCCFHCCCCFCWIFLLNTFNLFEKLRSMRCNVYSSKWVVNSFLENEIRMDFDRCIEIDRWDSFIHFKWNYQFDWPTYFPLFEGSTNFSVVGFVNIAWITIDLLLWYLLFNIIIDMGMGMEVQASFTIQNCSKLIIISKFCHVNSLIALAVKYLL